MPKKATKNTIKRIPIKPPAGIKKRGKGLLKARGGFVPMAIAAPLLAAAGVPIASALGNETVKGIKWGVAKVRKLLGVGVVRSGSTRMQGGRKKVVRRVVIRV